LLTVVLKSTISLSSGATICSEQEVDANITIETISKNFLPLSLIAKPAIRSIPKNEELKRTFMEIGKSEEAIDTVL
jgi:hypothetical protein